MTPVRWGFCNDYATTFHSSWKNKLLSAGSLGNFTSTLCLKHFFFTEQNKTLEEFMMLRLSDSKSWIFWGVVKIKSLHKSQNNVPLWCSADRSHTWHKHCSPNLSQHYPSMCDNAKVKTNPIKLPLTSQLPTQIQSPIAHVSKCNNKVINSSFFPAFLIVTHLKETILFTTLRKEYFEQCPDMIHVWKPLAIYLQSAWRDSSNCNSGSYSIGEVSSIHVVSGIDEFCWMWKMMRQCS